MPSSGLSIPGFSSDYSDRNSPCIAMFGPEMAGKTRLCASASIWALERDTVPGWLITDTKSSQTILNYCNELGIDPPLHNKEPFITRAESLQIASLADSDSDTQKVKEIYIKVIDRFIKAAVALADNPKIDPIIIDKASTIWDWISFSHFGKKQGVGREKAWGPPKQDWTTIKDALLSKMLLLVCNAKAEYKNNERTDRWTVDGPPHLGYTMTSLVRCLKEDRKLKPDETYVDLYRLDIVRSQDNAGLEGAEGILRGADISVTELLSLLRP